MRPKNSLNEALNHFLNHKPLGECTIVLGGATLVSSETFDSEKLLNEMKSVMINGDSASEAGRQIAKATGISRRSLYSLLHKKIDSDKD